MEENKKYKAAVETIKTAILQGQYEAAKDVNRVQLAVYYAVGKYLSLNTRKGVWGTGALRAISEQLRKELPGLRGFSETQMREMRLFYEGWETLDANSSVATDELDQLESSVITDKMQNALNVINIYQTLQITNTKDFPIEDFFRVPFTHHSRILATVKTREAR